MSGRIAWRHIAQSRQAHLKELLVRGKVITHVFEAELGPAGFFRYNRQGSGQEQNSEKESAKEQQRERITWIEEDAAQLLGSSCSILDHREACFTGRAVMIVHWNLEVSALEVGICAVDPKAVATSPGNLQYTRKDQ